jgi:hypothetical protein
LGLLLVALGACAGEAPKAPVAHRPVESVTPGRADIGGATVSLPKQIGDWTRPDAPRRITAETIFDYMDGAGELYLAYLFDHLDVFEYTSADGSLGTILVEIYSMKTPNDAFGLLSNDWGGEAVAFDPGPGQQRAAAVPPRRALYGAGLLRVWARDRYVRVLASRETKDSRAAVMRLGAEIMQGGLGLLNASSPPPGLLRGFDIDVDPSRRVRPERTCFFRSHLVLNSQYFLASQDILGLGLDVAAGTSEYAPAAKGERPIRVILVRYPSRERAHAGLASFLQGYLARAATKAPPANGEAEIEHGWVAWSLKLAEGPQLTLVLDAPDRRVARRFADILRPVTDAWL